MGDQLGYIVTDLKECFDGQPWYGDSVMKKLDSIDWRIVNDQNYGSKSIAVLLQHIIYWRIFVLKKLQGDSEYDIIIDGPTDWLEIIINSKREWAQLKLNIQETQKDILAFLSNCTDELLEQRVPGKDYTFGPILRSVSQHDLYHLGQIGMLNAKSIS